MTMAAPGSSDVIWHDAECGGYTADLGLWEALARDEGAPVLDLGCGTGRVALHLARRGHDVVAVDRDGALVAALRERAAGLPLEALAADALDLALDRRFPLAVAPMQLVQLLAGVEARAALLRGLASHLMPGGLAALAIVEDAAGDPPSSQLSGRRQIAEPPLPDTREVDGVVYSSLPLPTALDGDAIVVRRLRQTVAPDGRLGEERNEVRLRLLTAAELEREAGAAGLEPLRRRLVPPTEDHVGSTVVLLRKGGA